MNGNKSGIHIDDPQHYCRIRISNSGFESGSTTLCDKDTEKLGQEVLNNTGFRIHIGIYI
jgi:hypothetical protein